MYGKDRSSLSTSRQDRGNAILICRGVARRAKVEGWLAGSRGDDGEGLDSMESDSGLEPWRCRASGGGRGQAPRPSGAKKVWGSRCGSQWRGRAWRAWMGPGWAGRRESPQLLQCSLQGPGSRDSAGVGGHSSRKGRGFAGSPVDLELPIDVTRARACAISPRTSPAATCRCSPHSALTTYGLYGCQTVRLSDCRPPQTRAELNRTKQSRAVNVIVAHLPKGSSFGWLAWCSCLFGQEQPVSPAQPSCPSLCKAIVLDLRTCSCCSSVPSVPLSRATVPVNHHTHTHPLPPNYTLPDSTHYFLQSRSTDFTESSNGGYCQPIVPTFAAAHSAATTALLSTLRPPALD